MGPRTLIGMIVLAAVAVYVAWRRRTAATPSTRIVVQCSRGHVFEVPATVGRTRDRESGSRIALPTYCPVGRHLTTTWRVDPGRLTAEDLLAVKSTPQRAAIERHRTRRL